MNLTYFLTKNYSSIQKLMHRPNIRAKIIEVLEENREKYLNNLGLAVIFF